MPISASLRLRVSQVFVRIVDTYQVNREAAQQLFRLRVAAHYSVVRNILHGVVFKPRPRARLERRLFAGIEPPRPAPAELDGDRQVARFLAERLERLADALQRKPRAVLSRRVDDGTLERLEPLRGNGDFRLHRYGLVEIAEARRAENDRCEFHSL